jgi:hypothetical protein
MAERWVPNVMNAQKLTVFNGIAGHWTAVFDIALNSFNDLSKQYNLGVTLAKANDEKSANVVVRVGMGTVAYEFDGEKHTLVIDAFHGNTRSLGHASSSGDFLGWEKAMVFLPNTVKDNTRDIMTVLACHELIHACGLSNQDHGNDGLFYDMLSPRDGKMIVPEQGKNQRPMPPLWLAPATAQKIRKLWRKDLIDID